MLTLSTPCPQHPLPSGLQLNTCQHDPPKASDNLPALPQVTEALSFLHNSEQMLHGNVCPQTIVITRRGMWKLAGFGFAEKAREGRVSIETVLLGCHGDNRLSLSKQYWLTPPPLHTHTVHLEPQDGVGSKCPLCFLSFKG